MMVEWANHLLAFSFGKALVLAQKRPPGTLAGNRTRNISSSAFARRAGRSGRRLIVRRGSGKVRPEVEYLLHVGKESFLGPALAKCWPTPSRKCNHGHDPLAPAICCRVMHETEAPLPYRFSTISAFSPKRSARRWKTGSIRIEDPE